ncbi:unnamed protein product [Didymodactylos carnosus]|uniref:Uncharacterized protein n=2 Tax=Didymodactylos carnosus TaxID=1234261 RepID=A0A813Y0B1_9BILA|nr:unnamed protein product [Didymodactylos carnosus]CAF3661770.1 unnamed protein product [Didymodactylos carnosus]
MKSRTLEDFVDSVAKLPYFEDTPVTHMQIVNDNIQLVNMWLSAEETNVLDNALITMEHLYRSGFVHIQLRRLINEESEFEIEYSINKTQTLIKEDPENPIDENDEFLQPTEPEKIKFILTRSEVDDHKLQLTFCNVDLSEAMKSKKILLNEQLKLLSTVNNIYSTMIQLEMAGHPDYQLKEETFQLSDRAGEISRILSRVKDNENEETDILKRLAERQTDQLHLIHQQIVINHKLWLEHLEEYRKLTRLLQLFSNRQVMILIILLTKSTPDNRTKWHFLKKLHFKSDKNFNDNRELELTIKSLRHYLRSLRLFTCDLSVENIQRLYTKHQIPNRSSGESCLKKLSAFLKELLNDGKELFIERTTVNDNQQYLVTLTHKDQSVEPNPVDHDLDMETFSILVNILSHRLLASFQILWCSRATEDDIRLFFTRIQTFYHLTFVIMDIDKMHHRLREILFNEQDKLTKSDRPHGEVYYFSRELTSRKGLRPYLITPQIRNSMVANRKLDELFQSNNLIKPRLRVICGKAGIGKLNKLVCASNDDLLLSLGKTHRINTQYKTPQTLSISINDRLNSTTLINTLLSFDSTENDEEPKVYFNISIHAPFVELNRTFFSLFVCGALTDTDSGLAFSLPNDHQWTFFIKIPHTDKYNRNISDNFNKILPLLSLLNSNSFEEVTENNHKLCIGKQEELVARFLKAYVDRTINRLYVETSAKSDTGLQFTRLNNEEECRRQINDCMTRNAPELQRNKISELSFVKFLYRRVRFFTDSGFYRFNDNDEHLGTRAMGQMIEEAKNLSQMNFQGTDYPRMFLVYDPGFSLYLLHTDWDRVSQNLKQIFKLGDPAKRKDFEGKNYFAKCLSWLLDIRYDDFIDVMNETKFILTENFTYKLFHVHERKLTKLPLIIEGHTGVGKTFLLKFYSMLLNAKLAKGSLDGKVSPRIRERICVWLRKTVIEDIVEKKPHLYDAIFRQIQSKLSRNNDHINQPEINLPFQNQDEEEDAGDNNPAEDNDGFEVGDAIEQIARPGQAVQPIDDRFLKEIKSVLSSHGYDNDKLRFIWKTIINITHNTDLETCHILNKLLYEHVTFHITSFPLMSMSPQLGKLLDGNTLKASPLNSIKLFDEYLMHTNTKSLFYRLLLHPGITEEQLEDFMKPICQLANEVPDVELVIFFDEVNTSSCLGLFKEMFMDGTLHGNNLPTNIFCTAAINPSSVKQDDEKAVHRSDYLVHQLPQALENLKISYSTLESDTLKDYITKKIATFSLPGQQLTSLDLYIQEMLTECILKAQEFCEEFLGKNSVSQREIQRCFNLIEFFWKMRFDDETVEPDVKRCIALALALTYYFRLPTKEDNDQRNDQKTPSREMLAGILSRKVPDFVDIIERELVNFVNANNFLIPQGVAINQAVREHIFGIVVSIVTRTPLCIIGAPGQSKTLSFQIVLQNLQGPQLSNTTFCKKLPAIDPFFCLGSKYTRSEDIAYILDRAIKREQHYEQNRMKTRCVVFLDEASLPDEKKMVLKVLHPYLDECKVAFVAVANKSFDAANANRMICIYRSLPSREDQHILAYGCLGLKIDNQQQRVNDRLKKIINGLCQGYRRLLSTQLIPQIYHDRDFIYMLRQLRFELTTTTDEQETRVDGITPLSLLHALEENFNGISKEKFEELLQIFFKAVKEECPDFRLPNQRRNIPTILHQSMKLDSVRRRLYGRYKLIIDESEDESAVRLLAQSDVLDLDPNKIVVFRMSDFPDDVNNELRNVEILSTIKLCMETGKTILMINTGRIHGSLYDVFNQNFSIMATGDNRKIWSKVAIGPKTIDVVVHEDFQCIVHINRNEFKEIPAPFLSRFQKYSLSIKDFYQIRWTKLSIEEQKLMENVEQKAQSCIEHIGQQYFYGLSSNTLYSCLLGLIEKNDEEERYYLNIHQQYTQLTIKSKSVIEQNLTNTFQCLLRSILSRLMQLISPESIILKLPTFEDQVSRWICTNYFENQEHFSLENFLRTLTTSPISTMDVLHLENFDDRPNEIVRSITKVMIFTRTSSHITSLNQQTKRELFSSLKEDDLNLFSDKVDILNLSIMENSAELEEQFTKYENNAEKNLLLIVINGRTNQQRLHIPYVRQLIDKVDYRCNSEKQYNFKYFLLLVHSPPQTIYHQSSFPSIFLDRWDFHFFDTCLSNNSFYIKNFIQILTSSYENRVHQNDNQILCDYNVLFDDCLWDFCFRIQIVVQQLPRDLFENRCAYEFYQRQTSTFRRVQCLKEVLRQCSELQKRIVDKYQTYLSLKKNASKKIYTLIYQLSKDILCGKRFDGLVDSIQSQTRLSFNNFVCNILKHIVNDYGLETLPKLSNINDGYDTMLNLIDHVSTSNEQENDLLSTNTQTVFQLVTHYACIPQTPLYHLFHQRIKSYSDEIKMRLIEKTAEQKRNLATENDLKEHYYAVPDDDEMNNANENEHTIEEFRFELIKAIEKDLILMKIVNKSVLKTYSNDLVQTFCTIVEKNFTDDRVKCQKSIEFVSRWLCLVDENEQRVLGEYRHEDIWRLAHVYTSFEYDRNDLFSLYSACRIMDRLDQTQTFYHQLFDNDNSTRSLVRECLFRRMFDDLWKNLSDIRSNDQTKETWILCYTMISKYYPSSKVLQQTQLIDIKSHIEFMNLAHFILLNENLTKPEELVTKLLQQFEFLQQNELNYHGGQQKSPYIKRYSSIVGTVNEYIEEKNLPKSTLMIDVQQWIISILKATDTSYSEEIFSLFKYLNQPICPLALTIKEFLFDELANIYLKYVQRNQMIKDTWDRILLLPTMIRCASDGNSLENYRLPYHPSVINHGNTRSTLLDLFFSHLKRLMTNEVAHCTLINKIIQSTAPTIEIRQLQPSVEAVFRQIKEYFLVQLTPLLLCQTDRSVEDQPDVNRILLYMINNYLSIQNNATKLSEPLQNFLSIIVSKFSWNHLLKMLKSDDVQQQNQQWSVILSRFFENEQVIPAKKSSLQMSHQLGFTLASHDEQSIFPHLPQSYTELKRIIDQCVNQNNGEQRWKPFIDWITLNCQGNPPKLQPNEIRVIILLNIYYEYFCQDRLTLIDSLLPIIERNLDLSVEERLVFRALSQPEQSMIGYPKNQQDERNTLNNFFTRQCQNEDELRIRHCLVNLMAMILLGGKQSFLWTFAFQPLTLAHTHGFGTTAHAPIEEHGVHYDCGCIIDEKGDLLQFSGGASPLNVPGIYVTYFSTFGAMAWHLLLYEDSVRNLHGPVLAKHAVGAMSNECRMEGNLERTKVCHFVCARLLSTYHFLCTRFNQDDTCILINRCSEKMAYLTLRQQQWIKPVYTTYDDQFTAESQYQQHVFYFILQKLPDYKAQINQLSLQTEIQVNLQVYIDQIPIVVNYEHFKTELHNPNNFSLSLNILRRILSSTGFLEMTRTIYDLSHFYLLLHQTYSFLIEREEFYQITLKDLSKRAEQNSNIVDQRLRTQHHSIIDNGLKAINLYHTFADGLIQPGACDETQRFNKVSIETPIHYLVTNENHDEGDIVMRILSVLADYHNGLLDLLEKELKNDPNDRMTVLKSLVYDIVSKDVSILQIARDNTGVITLTANDVLWLSKLSRASLTIDTENFFEIKENLLKFDFRYIQSFIIRTHLLLCRINFRHIVQKYQCYRRKNQTNNKFEMIELDENYSKEIDRDKLETEWNHLKDMLVDKLTNGYKLLQQIMLLIKSNDQNLSHLSLNEFLDIHADQTIREQCELYEIRNFQLCYLNHIQELYSNAINDFQYLFTDVPHLLRTPINDQLNEKLKQAIKVNLIDIEYNDHVEKLKSTIHMISEFLNDLRGIEVSLFEQSTQSLPKTCEYMAIDNPILSWIPSEIRCENYISLSIHLIRCRSILQEKLVNIQEKQNILWVEEIDENQNPTESKNTFLNYLNSKEDNSQDELVNNLIGGDGFNLPPTTMNGNYHWDSVNHLLDQDDQKPMKTTIDNQQMKQDEIINDEKIDCPALYTMQLKSLPFESSPWFDLLNQLKTPDGEEEKKAKSVSIIHPDEKKSSHLLKKEKLFEQFQKIFKDKGYSCETLIPVDKYHIGLDLKDDNPSLPPDFPLEYSILQRTSLIQVKVEYEEKSVDYFTKSEFNDQEKRKVRLILTEENRSTSFNEIHYRTAQDEEKIILLHPNTVWQNLDNWFREQPVAKNLGKGYFSYFLKEQNSIVDETDKISSTVEPITIDVISRDSTMNVKISYENQFEKICVLKATKINQLLNNQNLLPKLNLNANSLRDCVLAIGENPDQRLSNEDTHKSIGEFSVDDQQVVEFRIALLIQILTLNNNEKPEEVLLFNRKVTIEELFRISKGSERGYKYLASYNTKKIIDFHQLLSDVNETRFLLMKEDQFCSVHIRRSSENQLISIDGGEMTSKQDFASSATIADVYKANNINNQNEYLLFGKDFLPSMETSLSVFVSTSPIEFDVSNEELPIHFIVENSIDKQTINYRSSSQTQFNRLCSIACQLMHLNPKFYQLMYNGTELSDDELCLDDLETVPNEVKLELICISPLKASIKFEQVEVLIPCTEETLALELTEEALLKLNFLKSDLSQFELFALADQETQVEMDYKIEDVREIFPGNTETMKLELRKKS